MVRYTFKENSLTKYKNRPKNIKTEKQLFLGFLVFMFFGKKRANIFS